MIVDIVYGFLGSGKTTFIMRILEEWGASEKTAVLVNEFGDVGIDGELLSNKGGNVVEMPSGCICCTLQSDFRSQILDISRTIRPDRVIIEPTGVATIRQIRSIVEAQLFEDTIQKTHNILIADATAFMGLYKANRHFVESQVKNAHLALLNKCDRVEKRKAMLNRDAITSINPELSVLMAEYGKVDWAEYKHALSSFTGLEQDHDHHENHITEIESHPHEVSGLHREDDKVHPHFHEEDDALGYESFGSAYGEMSFDKGTLENFFYKLNANDSGLGEVVRAKGIFRIGEKWILMELSSGEFSSQQVSQSNQSKVSIIGKGLNRESIKTSLRNCLSA